MLKNISKIEHSLRTLYYKYYYVTNLHFLFDILFLMTGKKTEKELITKYDFFYKHVVLVYFVYYHQCSETLKKCSTV